MRPNSAGFAVLMAGVVRASARSPHPRPAEVLPASAFGRPQLLLNRRSLASWRRSPWAATSRSSSARPKARAAQPQLISVPVSAATAGPDEADAAGEDAGTVAAAGAEGAVEGAAGPR